MRMTVIILSILLALLLAYTGAVTALNTSTAQRNAAHFSIDPQRYRLIGLAELAAVAGLLIGIAFKPLLIVTAIAVVALMIGAIGYHRKVNDPTKDMLPAALTAAAAIAIGVVSILA